MHARMGQFSCQWDSGPHSYLQDQQVAPCPASLTGLHRPSRSTFSRSVDTVMHANGCSPREGNEFSIKLLQHCSP